MRQRPTRHGLYATLCGALTLAACGPTVAERRMHSIYADIPAAMQFQQSCRAAVFARPENSEFAGRMPTFADEATAAQLSNGARVGSQQRSSLATMFAGLAECRRGTAARLRSALPEATVLMQQAEVAGERNWAALVGGQITWGEANTEAQRLANDFRTGSSEVVSGTVSGLQAEHAQEVQRRGEAVLGAVVLVAAGAALAATSRGYYTSPNLVRVQSYTRRDGTYVPSHVRTAPDGSRSNNRSYRR